MPNYKLYYFNERGRAEISRLLFAAAGVKFEDVRYTKEEWLKKYKPMMPTGRCPVLEVDGYKISQSLTIARYLANTFGFTGQSPLEKAQVEQIMDEMDNLLTKYYDFYFRCPEGAKVTERKKLISEEFPRLMGVVLKWQEESGGQGFMVGSSLTMADLELYECCTTYLNEENSILNSFPSLKEHQKLIESQPGLSEYLKTRPLRPV